MWEMLPGSKNQTTSLSSTRSGPRVSNKKDEPGCFLHIRQELKNRGIQQGARDLILQSWRDGTKQKYNVYINQWFEFCKSKSIDPFHPELRFILMFLTGLYTKGLKYNSINVARSALSSFLKICGNIDLNSFEEIKRFMKGVFQSRPALPRYEETWDVNIVLQYLSSFHNTTLYQISCQLCMLFLLTSAQRCQTLHLIELQDIQFSTNKVVIYPNHLLKQSKPGQHLEVMQFAKFEEDKTCVLFQYYQTICRGLNIFVQVKNF